jgi:hypothetical protein
LGGIQEGNDSTKKEDKRMTRSDLLTSLFPTVEGKDIKAVMELVDAYVASEVAAKDGEIARMGVDQRALQSVIDRQSHTLEERLRATRDGKREIKRLREGIEIIFKALSLALNPILPELNAEVQKRASELLESPADGGGEEPKVTFSPETVTVVKSALFALIYKHYRGDTANEIIEGMKPKEGKSHE